MSRINTNVQSFVARLNLDRSNADLDTRLQRLSTGLRINRGADDPAGLIVSQRLGSEINGIEQAVRNSERASSVISTAEGALNEVADLLNSIKGLVVEAANTGALSDEERQANQLQIDSAIESITRISNSTSFGGLKLLNGSLDYVLSGLHTSAVSKAQIFGANFAGQANVNVAVETVASAQTGRLFLRGDYTGGFGNGAVQSSVSLEVAGSRGVQVLQFLSGRSLSEVVQGVNAFKEATGVSASLVNGNVNSGVVFSTIDFGSDRFVSVQRQGGPSDGGFFRTYALTPNTSVPASVDIPTLITAGTLVASNRDTGRDVVAVVNGTLGTGRGLRISLPNSQSLNLDLELNVDFATRNGATSSFSITGGGALYQLGGDINSTQQLNVGLPSITASRLGGTLIAGELSFLSSLQSGGSNDLRSRNFQSATDILGAAISEVSVVRGRLGALEKNTLETNVRSLQTAIENLTSSQSRIRDADFAAESSALTRAQILSNAGTSTLALANQRAQQVLSLLRQ
ncbi:MAG: flagellin N-terminal helical domain-containing protein [Phycisphaerales bacterium]